MSPRKKSNRKPVKPRTKKQQNQKKHKDSGFLDAAFKKHFHLSAILLIGVLGFLAYSNTFDAEMQFDDGLQIVSKDHVNNLAHFTSFSDWTNVNKRPLSNFGFALNYYFGEYDVKGYHIVNLIIHLLSAVLVFFLSVRIFGAASNNILTAKPDYKNVAALLAALLFVAHPIQTQGVTYIVQRMTSQSAMFYLLAVLLYAIGRSNHLSGNKRKALLFYLATFISTVASLLSKQIAVTIPFALLLYEFFFVRGKEGKVFVRYILVSLSVLLIGVVFVLFSGLLPAETDEISRYQYLITQSRVIVKYVQLLILPIRQNVDYSFSLSESVWGWKELLSITFLIGVLGLALAFLKKRPVISFGIFWIFLTLAIESSIIPISDVIFEHRLYLPMFGFALIVTDGIFQMFGNSKTKHAILVLSAIVVVFSLATYNRNMVWRTQYSLWLDTMEKSPDKTRPLINLIYLYSDEGRHKEAIGYARKALEIDPADGHVYFVAGAANEKAGNEKAAIRYYKKAIEIDKESRQAMNNLGSIYLKKKKYKEAAKYFLMALDDSRKQTAVLKNLVLTHYKLSDFRNTIRYAKIYLRKEPEDITVLSRLGDSYLSLKETGQAIQIYEKVIRLAPERVSTFNNLGTCYYLKADYEKAAHYYREALKIDPANKNAKQYLSMTRKFLKK